MRYFRILTSFLAGLGIAAAFLGWMSPPKNATAAGDAPPLCVKPGGGDSCYATIQAAVDAAPSGAVIRVAQGNYLETVLIEDDLALRGGYNTSFTARNWDLYPSKIDARQAGSVIRINGPYSVTIEGFTITGGDASGYVGWGGGILADGDWADPGSILIRDNVITDNVACRSVACQGYGGGVMIYSHNSVIEDNLIISNVARTTKSGNGGGIAIWGYPQSSLISGNRILSNTAVLSTTDSFTGEGGGIWAEGSCGMVVSKNLIQSNVAAGKGNGSGGGVYTCGYYYGNEIISNTATLSGTGKGGGVYAYHVPQFEENLVKGNLASKVGSGYGGGVYSLYLMNAQQNTIERNTAMEGGGVYFQKYDGHQVFSENLIQGNLASGLDILGLNGGGGIASLADWIEIKNNDILSNTGLAGGGIRFTGGDDDSLAGNRIQGNIAIAGGGIFVYTTTATIDHNQLLNNTAAWWGGGLFLLGHSSPVMDSNQVIGNLVGGYSGVAGGGIMISVAESSRVTLTNHIIARNKINSETASGVHCFSGSCDLIHCTIVDNKFGSAPGEGVRISALGGTNRVWNSIIVGHSTGVVQGGAVLAQLDYNDYFDNSVNVSGFAPGAHSLLISPLFVNRAAGDYHLSAGSPLINAGDASLSTLLDFEGDPRLVKPEIGADEYIYARRYFPQIFKDWSNIPR